MLQDENTEMKNTISIKETANDFEALELRSKIKILEEKMAAKEVSALGEEN